ncbi:male-specific lethal 1 homolog isoform X1 [Neoarius graeffei]|uniref:male-specific lethal 1 homolog isoform X1 n=2 Tax=Neoarius graeffei TaxID=443677 RepID=UPI00298CF097|nr:male-specific lethal 1 homolog isoform X1 [Neoarius graeffei]
MNMRTESILNVGLRSESKSFYLSKGHTIGVPRNSHTLLTETHDSVGITLKDAGQRFVKSRNLAKDLGGKAVRPLLPVGQNKAGASGTSSENADKSVSQTKPMGGEGTPIKSKTPLGQTSTTDHKTDFFSMNSHNSRDSGGEDSTKGFETMGAQSMASHEHAEGKRNNLRKTSSHPSSQANCLHQLLLLQLDLIEQQQQQLQSKDKEIDELKADRDTLLARIERMERRLQLMSKEPRDKRLFQPLERWVPDTDDFWDLDIGDSHQTPTLKTPFSRSSKAQKRKCGFLDSKTQRSQGKSSRITPQKSDTRAASPCQRELRNKETPEKTAPARSSGPTEVVADAEESCENEDFSYMTTTEMYLCCWHQPPVSPLCEASPKKEDDVAIPSWRENSIEPLREEDALDISESLEDGMFLKRHSKLELDEKRRKRWDIQRIREQRMLQRLQQRMEKRKLNIQECEPEISSFYPDADDVESVVITPFLPVVAFGRPLPRLMPQNFELPWLDERSRCRIENQKKQTPHRTCRK